MKLKVYTCLYFFIKISLNLLSIFCLVYNALLLWIFNYVVFHIISQSFFSSLYLCMIFWPSHMACEGSKLFMLQWKRGVLTTGLPGKSLFKKKSAIKSISFFFLSWILGFSSCLVRFSSLHLYQRFFSSILPSNYIHISMQRVGHDLATEWHQFKFIWILILVHGMKEKSFPSSQ